MMTSRLRTYKHATYLNITPAAHTWTMLEALGYRRFCNGAFFAVAALSGRSLTATVRRVTSDVEAGRPIARRGRAVARPPLCRL